MATLALNSESSKGAGLKMKKKGRGRRGGRELSDLQATVLSFTLRTSENLVENFESSTPEGCLYRCGRARRLVSSGLSEPCCPLESLKGVGCPAYLHTHTLFLSRARVLVLVLVVGVVVVTVVVVAVAVAAAAAVAVAVRLHLLVFFFPFYSLAFFFPLSSRTMLLCSTCMLSDESMTHA